jgi:hypothetical protein
MAAATNLTNEQRVLRARLAAHASWANTEDRSARTAAGHRAGPGSVDYWERKLDPEGQFDPTECHLRAESARNAYMTRLAFNASKARARKAA